MNSWPAALLALARGRPEMLPKPRGPGPTRPPPSRGPSVRLLAQTKNRKATTWNHITHPWFVDWHVRAGDWPLSMPSDYGSAGVKGSIYSTVMINHHKCNNDKC